jgi:multiple sugar transport system substrate-binding protein
MTGRTIRKASGGLGIALIAALAAGSAATAQSAAPTSITFWSWVPGIEDQVNAFNASQSAIHVEYVNKGNGNTEYAALKTALEANSDVPDAVQIEFQHLPSFIARGELADLAQFGAKDVASQFLPWTVSQVSQGDAIYAYPQDAGPMIMMCNQELLDANKITAPTTWDEFKTAAAALHAADSTKYLANFTADQGHFFGLLWQSGAKPFTVDGTNITIDFASPEVTRVAQLWDDMRTAGTLAPVDTYSSDWNTALGNGTIACWTAGAWGPEVVQPAAPDLSGKWKAYEMPNWTAGTAVNGNYGGSTIAVTSASQHQAEAETFNRWLNTDPGPTLALANGAAGLFPVTNATLANPEWTDYTSDFFGGQKLHEVTAAAAQAVDVSFQWPPFTDFVYQTYADELTAVAAGNSTLVQTMADLQTKVTQYATDQGFTVVAP